MIALDFDTTVGALRRLQNGDALADIAHAAGYSTNRYAAGLLAHLAEVRATVETAARGGGQVFRVGVRERVDGRYGYTPGGAIVTRPPPADPPPPRTLRTDVHGKLDAADLRPGEVFVPREERP